MRERAQKNLRLYLACARNVGKWGHKSEECYRPLVCSRCKKKEGHVPRACSEYLPWECIDPFCGLAAPELGFHIIQDEDSGDIAKDKSNYALITIKQGPATARQVENEYKAQAGASSTWRWFAKKVAENKFQMKFPTAKEIEDLGFLSGMLMGTVPGVTFKVEPWNPHVGAKAKIEEAWFRIDGITFEKRSEKRACYVACLVGIPLEVDKVNLKKWDYVRVKIGCKSIAKVPDVVEGLLDMHFYDFIFQREVVTEMANKTPWNTWTRNAERGPFPKKAQKS
jgi:hypothetical protein